MHPNASSDSQDAIVESELAAHDPTTVRDLIDQAARCRGETTFLISPETGEGLSFRGLQKQSRAIAALLRLQGVDKSDKVAFLLDNGIFTAQLLLGVIYSGAVAVPLNVRAGLDHLSYTLEHCDASLVFVEGQYRTLAEEALAHVSRRIQVIDADVDRSASELGGLPTHIETPMVSPDDPALLMYTSGSVGRPKAAIHSHATVLAHGHNSIHAHQLASTDRSLLVLPLYHINAECVTLIPSLMAGGSVVIPHRFFVNQFWDLLEEYNCTWSAVVPTIVSQLLDWENPRRGHRAATLEHIRFLRSSSAPLSPSLHREFLDKFDLLLIQAMGSSEAGNVFSNPLPPGENKIGSPGLPWGFETRIIDRRGVDVMLGEPGEVLLRGPALMQGYYKDPEATDAAIDSEGWLHTGDLAFRDKDGYFFVVGRAKELIIKAGVNIAPKQIDEVLESHPAVLEAAAVGVPDRYLGEDLIAFVVLRSGARIKERDIQAFCELRLGHFKTPTRIRFVTDLPKGPSGKVQRLRLQEWIQEERGGSSEEHGDRVSYDTLAVPPSEFESAIAEIWAELLGQPGVDRNSNFFALGGHSLLAVQCLSKIRDRFSVALSLADFFENAIVAQQAALLKERLRAHIELPTELPLETSSPAWEQALLKQTPLSPASATIPRRDPSQPSFLSSGQRRIWFFGELAPDVPLYNESEAVQLFGELNCDSLENALNEVVARHEVLRSTIRIERGEPVAVVHDNRRVRLKRIDLSAMGTAEREAEISRLLVEEPRIPYQLKLEAGIRATLLTLGAKDHIFILLMHHLVCDWASEGIVWRELSASYRAFCRGEKPSLRPLQIQHGDYAAWQRKQAVAGAYGADMNYWEEMLRGAPELLEIPTDRPRPAVQSFAGKRQRYQLEQGTTALIRKCSVLEQVSLFTVCAAALNVLLFRYTGREDISIGIPLADRDRAEVQPLIGFFLHTHVLRTFLTESMTFRELLGRIQRGILDLYAHRAVPFDQLVNTLKPDRNLSYNPLFQVMLNWRDRDQQLSFIGLDGIEVTSLLAESRTSKFDITLMLTDSGDHMGLEIEFNTDLFNEQRISRMFGHFQTIVESAAANPNQEMGDVPLLTAAESDQMRVDWNRAISKHSGHRTLHQLFEEQAERTPKSVAAVFASHQLTYSELNSRADLFATSLRAAGAKPNCLIGIFVERSLEMLVGLLGILKAGAAYVPLDPAYPGERLDFMLRDCEPLILVTQRSLQARLPRTHASTVFLDDLKIINVSSHNPPMMSTAKPADLAYVLYTSGSTGKPKGVQIPHRALVNVLNAMQRLPGIAAHDVMLAITTLSFDIAALELFLPLISGARVVIADRESIVDGRRLSALIQRCGATVLQATPATWRLLIDSGWNGHPRMKALCGGEAWSSALATELLARCKSVWNMYGPTETTIWSAVDRVEADRPVLIGYPIANTSFYVLDNRLHPVPIGIPGELYIGGDGLANGYYKRPDLTKERFVQNPFGQHSQEKLYRTGDLVRRMDDGRIEFVRRVDHQVKVRGFRIELGEIESHLRNLAGIKDAVVLTREDVGKEKRLVAYYTAPEALNTSYLRKQLESRMPEYMVPAAYVHMQTFPLTPNGKLDRTALPAPEINSTGIDGHAAPTGPTENALANIWARTIMVDQIGRDDNFFELGGHSLLATRLFAEIEDAFRVRLPFSTLFSAPTVRSMARIVETQQSPVAWRSLVPIQTSGFRRPLFCFHGAGGNVLLYRTLAACLGPNQPVYGLESQGLDGVSRPLTSIEAMAALYVKEIRTVQARGPYLLAGYCMGGSVAYEAAQQLRTAGEPVALLALFDTLNWHRVNFTTWKRSARNLQRVLFHAAAVFNLDPEGRRRFLRAKISDLRGRIPIWCNRVITSLDSSNSMAQKSSALAASVWRTNHQAARRYIPAPYDGKITDFRPRRQYAVLKRPDFKWDALAKEGQVVEVIPGYPGVMLVEPFVQDLAISLQKAIAAVSSD